MDTQMIDQTNDQVQINTNSNNQNNQSNDDWLRQDTLVADSFDEYFPDDLQVGTTGLKNPQTTTNINDLYLNNEDLQQNQNDESLDISKQDLTPRSAIKTRRQSKGITYFNRMNSTIDITIGTLDEWHEQFIQRQNLKRRKMNTQHLPDDPKNEDDLYIDLELAKQQATASNKLNKTFLHESWLEEFEKEKKRIEQRNKKRKRQSEQLSNVSQRSSRSRSPTPVTKSGPLITNDEVVNVNILSGKRGKRGSSVQSDNSDYQKPVLNDQNQTIQQIQVKEQQKPVENTAKKNDKKVISPKISNKGSNRGKGSKQNSKASNQSEESEYDSEEEDRRETEKMKIMIMAELEKKDEPLDSQSLSTALKYAQKYIEEGLKILIADNKIQKKDIGKKAYYISISQESTQQYQRSKPEILDKIQQLKDLEKVNNDLDTDLNKVEKQVKDLKLKPTSRQVATDIQKLQDEINVVKNEIDQFKHSDLYLGDQMLVKLRSMYHKLDQLIQIYKKRKDGCMDIIDYFSQHLNIDHADVVRRCGINAQDLEISPELIEILGIDPEDLKKKEESSSEEEEEEEDEVEEESSEEKENKTITNKKQSDTQHQYVTTSSGRRSRKVSIQDESDITEVKNNKKQQSKKQTPKKSNAKQSNKQNSNQSDQEMQ